MLPADFVWLDKLPLNSSGKLDRQALPTPDRTRPELGVTLETPGTETEKSVAAIWMELLGVDRVGLHDNFFELGGHSLLATQVLARIQSRLTLRCHCGFCSTTQPSQSWLARLSRHDQTGQARFSPFLADLPDDSWVQCSYRS